MLTVQSLLALGADPAAADRYGLTPLLFAAEAGQREAALALLAHGGSDVDASRWAQRASPPVASSHTRTMKSMLPRPSHPRTPERALPTRGEVHVPLPPQSPTPERTLPARNF